MKSDDLSLAEVEAIFQTDDLYSFIIDYPYFDSDGHLPFYQNFCIEKLKYETDVDVYTDALVLAGTIDFYSNDILAATLIRYFASTSYFFRGCILGYWMDVHKLIDKELYLYVHNMCWEKTRSPELHYEISLNKLVYEDDGYWRQYLVDFDHPKSITPYYVAANKFSYHPYFYENSVYIKQFRAIVEGKNLRQSVKKELLERVSDKHKG